MWHTPAGDRVLTGAEAMLIKAAISGVADYIREEASGFGEPWEYGISMYDSLSWTERSALLDRVATFLLFDSPESIELTAVNEAAAAALFEHIEFEVAFEVDSQPEMGTRWRQMVRDAYIETIPEEGDEADQEVFGPPSIDSGDLEEWNIVIQVLANRVLWDADFAMQDLFLDADPDKASFLRSFGGIDEDYFAAAPPDAASDDEGHDLLRKLAAMSDG